MNDILQNTHNLHTCAICLDEVLISGANMCITECMHVFHLSCFLQNREFNTTCPMCRADILIAQQNDQAYQIGLPDIMIENDDNNQPNLLHNRFDVFEEIANGSQLERRIREIVDFAANNNISNIELADLDNVFQQIHNICMFFVDSAFNYFRNIEQIELHIDNINIEFHSYNFNLHEKIGIIIDNACNNNIRNNITFDRMEHDIYNLCIEFGDSIISTEQDNL
jgi:hypothetical protein